MGEITNNLKKINWPEQNYLASKSGKTNSWLNLHGSARGLALNRLLTADAPYLIITENHQSAQQTLQQIRLFSADNNEQYNLHYFPDRETLAYDPFSPHPDLISTRIDLLNQLPKHKNGITVIAVATLLQLLAPRSFFQQTDFNLKISQQITQPQIVQQLEQTGYRRVEQVMEHGEYSVRGAIIDFFATGNNQPLRIELFDDEIESLRYFDPESQCSTTKITATKMQAAREYPLDEDAISFFRQQWRENFPGAAQKCPIYQSISDGIAIAGIEYYLPLFFDELSSFFSYISADTICIQIGDIEQAMHNQLKMIQQRFEQHSIDPARPLCLPESLYLSAAKCMQQINAYPNIIISSQEAKQTDNIKAVADADPDADAYNLIDFHTKPAPKLELNLRDSEPLKPLINFLKNKNLQCIISCTTAGREQTIQDFLRDLKQPYTAVNSWPQAVDLMQKNITTGENHIYTLSSELTEGMWLTHLPVLALTENELFANFVPQTRRRKDQAQHIGQQLNSLQKLQLGSPVVHRDHGVGRYRGLETITSGDIDTECMIVEYTAGAKIYVPTQGINVISRYIGTDPDNAPLHQLGRSSWQKNKDKSLERIRDLAAELLRLYSYRQSQTGFAFPKPDNNYRSFCAAFPFEETPDQQKTINEVIEDMCSERCMDRLVCGDVGFGKTEVAMRAAFLAVMAAKQVAILVPTTLLAQQHFRSLCDRFVQWPVKIACLSRLNTAKEQAACLANLQQGNIDIVISTHKLLHQELPFKDLGLLIIDEEHRFGVKQKDRLKKIRADVDILAMTATPIPRTLNQALLGTRDLSIIATPPPSRSAIQTFIREYQPTLIKEALTRELQRGGQAYYLHNKVSTIKATCDKIKSLLPEAKVRFAHGQMREGELEAIMRDFYNQQFNVLVATTIIESGIDIPSANTIIIERADKFGLAELYQIRGRVGRSHHQAYAYLLTPAEAALAPDAKKRLKAIAACKQLGAGFNLASEDLEIRGAGELLGDKQSGQILSIGFSLYMEMLQQTMQKMQQGELNSEDDILTTETLVDLPIPALIPEEYIHDIPLRLEMYKQVSNCSSEKQLRELKAQLHDRFGTMPSQVNNLWNVHRLRIIATKLGIKQIEGSQKFIYYTFAKNNNVNHKTIMQLLQQTQSPFSLKGVDVLRQQVDKDLLKNIDAIDRYIETIKQTLEMLGNSSEKSAG